MSKITKIGNIKFLCFSQYQIDRIPNVPLGKNCRIRTNEILKRDPRLNQFFNDNTMGALDNYAEHENLTICITPLENDLFNDAMFAVHKDTGMYVKYPIDVPKTKEEVPLFFRYLYNKVHKTTYPSEKSIKTPIVKHSKFEDVKMYFHNIRDRFANLSKKWQLFF